MDLKYIDIARNDSDFDSIRSHPCFKGLVSD